MWVLCWPLCVAQRPTRGRVRQGLHCGHMQLALGQLSKRDVTAAVILQGHEEHGARPWEMCSLASQAGTGLVSPGGQAVSVLAFSTFKFVTETLTRVGQWTATPSRAARSELSQAGKVY